jgi:chromosome segregation ATPase
LVLSLFGLAIVITLIVLIAAAAAFAMWRSGGSILRRRNYDWLNLPGELPAILGDFQQSIEGAQAEAQRAVKMGDAVVSAAKAIEAALKDFRKRITELEGRADDGEKRLDELKTSVTLHQTSLNEHAQGLTAINKSLKELTAQLAALTEQTAALKTASDSTMALQKQTSEELRAVGSELAAAKSQINSDLADATSQVSGDLGAFKTQITGDLGSFKSQITGDLAAAKTRITGELVALTAEAARLSDRMDDAETGHSRLAGLADTMGKSVAALKKAAEKAAQDLTAMEPRLMWKIEALETIVHGPSATPEKAAFDRVADHPGDHFGERRDDHAEEHASHRLEVDLDPLEDLIANLEDVLKEHPTHPDGHAAADALHHEAEDDLSTAPTRPSIAHDPAEDAHATPDDAIEDHVEDDRKAETITLRSRNDKRERQGGPQ